MAKNSFSFDSPLVQSFETIKNLLILNIWTVICCIPVITAGASFAAMHTVALKMLRDEEGYVTRDFFKAFRNNIKIGCKASILLVLVLGFVYADFYAISLLDVWFADVARVLLLVFGILLALTLTFLFPVMAKFDAGLVNTIKNAFRFALSHIGKTLVMLILNLIPWVLCYYVNILIPLLFFFGLSVPAMMGAKLYDKDFKRLEDAYYEKQNI